MAGLGFDFLWEISRRLASSQVETLGQRAEIFEAPVHIWRSLFSVLGFMESPLSLLYHALGHESFSSLASPRHLSPRPKVGVCSWFHSGPQGFNFLSAKSPLTPGLLLRLPSYPESWTNNSSPLWQLSEFFKQMIFVLCADPQPLLDLTPLHLT